MTGVVMMFCIVKIIVVKMTIFHEDADDRVSVVFLRTGRSGRVLGAAARRPASKQEDD